MDLKLIKYVDIMSIVFYFSNVNSCVFNFKFMHYTRPICVIFMHLVTIQ